MNYLFRIIFKYFFLIALCCLLISCSKLTQGNFDKINSGMSMQEVVVILGEPTKVYTFNIAGVSAASAVWKDNNVEIVIQFLNDQVLMKNFSKNLQENPIIKEPDKK